MMSAWQGSTGVGALALEQGFCVLFDYTIGKIIGVFSNKSRKLTGYTSSQLSSNVCPRCSDYRTGRQVRAVCFAADWPILLFAETRSFLHVVDLNGWQQQILGPPPFLPGKEGNAGSGEEDEADLPD